MFNSSFGQLSMTRPSFYIPEPHHKLRDVITHSYGICQGNEPLFSTLLQYLVALNPEIKNLRAPVATPNIFQILPALAWAYLGTLAGRTTTS